MKEKNYDPGFTRVPKPTVDLTTTFFHHFLRAVLNVHAARIRSLHLYTLLPLHPDIYLQIRDGMPNLQFITFTGNIDATLQSQFEEPTPWASGKTGALEGLTLFHCELHSMYFARNVLCGVYGTRLKHMRIIACGTDNHDKAYTLSGFTLVPVSIDELQLHHPLAWELSVMALYQSMT